MSLSTAERIELAESVIYQEVEGEIVILDLAKQEYYGLDATGASMWLALLKHRNLDGVFDQLSTEYDVDSAVLRADLETLVNQLVGSGLLKLRVP